MLLTSPPVELGSHKAGQAAFFDAADARWETGAIPAVRRPSTVGCSSTSSSKRSEGSASCSPVQPSSRSAADPEWMPSTSRGPVRASSPQTFRSRPRGERASGKAARCVADAACRGRRGAAVRGPLGGHRVRTRRASPPRESVCRAERDGSRRPPRRVRQRARAGGRDVDRGARPTVGKRAQEAGTVSNASIPGSIVAALEAAELEHRAAPPWLLMV